jgi:hypothetical protein
MTDTLRETLTRYAWDYAAIADAVEKDLRGKAWAVGGGDLAELVARALRAVEARDQAREAEIRELMELPAHWRRLAESSRTTEIGDRLRFCANALEVELEALLTPPQEREPR